MNIVTTFENKVIPDQFAKYSKDHEFGMPIISFPFQVTEIPENCQTLAWTFLDYDAVLVCGFPYIHWLVANVNRETTEFEADFSRFDNHHIEGKNSLTSKFLSDDVKIIDQQYIGPKPPDKDHKYILTVYALDQELQLENGFYLNELYQQIKNHVVDQASIEVIGRC